MNTKTAKNIRIIDFLNALGCQPKRTVGHNYFYLSPLRTEKTASMKVDDKLNLWYDHGSAQGGTIIDLVLAMKKAGTVSEALSFLKDLNLKTDFAFNENKGKIENQLITRESSIKIERIQSLQDSKLLNYLRERKINIDIAQKYLQEIHYSVGGMKYLALGWLNNSGGYHLRSEFFKGCTSQNISIIKGNNPNLENKICLVYEGMFDFLSHLTLKNENQFKVDCIILNSLSNLNKTKEYLKGYSDIHLFLDNDKAGETCKNIILKSFPEAKDHSEIYAPHKDFNNYLLFQNKTEIENKNQREQQRNLKMDQQKNEINPVYRIKR